MIIRYDGSYIFLHEFLQLFILFIFQNMFSKWHSYILLYNSHKICTELNWIRHDHNVICAVHKIQFTT